MIMSSARLAALLMVCLAAAVGGRAADLPIIEKARAFVGGEALLKRIESIHYVGRIVGPDPADPGKQMSAAIEIVVQKPYQYRVTVTSDQTIDSTALDGYDAWNRRTAVGDPKRWQQTVQGTEQIKRLRANAWENISFYSGLSREGGVVEDKGPVQFEGLSCEKVAFVYSPNIIYYRYFDVATGRLVFSETETGSSIREQGEVRVDGVRFPKTLVSITKDGDGPAKTITITFDKITLNEKFPASYFAVPSLAPR